MLNNWEATQCEGDEDPGSGDGGGSGSGSGGGTVQQRVLKYRRHVEVGSSSGFSRTPDGFVSGINGHASKGADDAA